MISKGGFTFGLEKSTQIPFHKNKNQKKKEEIFWQENNKAKI